MTESLTTRAVATEGWRWLPGMLVLTRDGLHLRISATTKSGASDAGSFIGVTRTGKAYGWRRKGLPDLTDPATLGCLLHLVRKAWADRGTVHVDEPVAEALGEPWIVRVLDGMADRIWTSRGATEAEALIAALEAAAKNR